MAEDLAGWRDYYVLVGNVGAVLAGLVFVAMTLRPALVSAEHATERVSARQIFGNFIGAVVVSLVMLAPWSDALWLAAAATLAGGFGLLTSLRRFRGIAFGGRRAALVVAGQALTTLGGAAIAVAPPAGLALVALGIGTIEVLAFAGTWQLVAD